MKNFVGIDLGTTNSAICSYDGSQTRIWKSPEQNDVTPSAIYIDNRGRKFIGKRAYDIAPKNPDNTAVLFKRLMGTNTPINFASLNIIMTPEECSTEILKVIFNYLPDQLKNDPETGTIITVPAAFNQMQKTATMQAADKAGIGKVALMQEPVAAVMSVMRIRNTNGIFLIYDLGGGTLDIAVAESSSGNVTLLAHGGIAVCGGRDFDRTLVDNVVRPWLENNFNLPKDFLSDPKFKSLIRLATWATENAKIELSVKEETTIALSETELNLKDLKNHEIYLDIPLKRDIFDQLIEQRLNESIEATRETIHKAGLSPHDLERIVFIGGPTNYEPLRKKVAFELGIPGSTDVNPMTAVAEGASIFAESIDWNSQNRSRKDVHGSIATGGRLAVSFTYTARTPDIKAKIIVKLANQATPGSEFQIDSLNTGWTSGRMPLKQGLIIDVNLTILGENVFKVFVFDAVGRSLVLEQDKIIITRTAATVEAIPASHSVGIEAMEKLGGPTTLVYLVRSGDLLPKKNRLIFKAAESLKAGAYNSINLKLWEGEIEDPINDNRLIGVLKISGNDFSDGVIHAGADLECDFEMLDSGNIILEVSVPSIGGTFSNGKNFYSRQEGQIDYSTASGIVIEEGKRTLNRIFQITQVIKSEKLIQAINKLNYAIFLDPDQVEPEKCQEAMEKILEARKILDQVRKEHINEIRQIDLDELILRFNKQTRQYATPAEIIAFDNLIKTSQRSIDHNDKDFEHHIKELRSKNYNILWRQDWYIIDQFKLLIERPHFYADKRRFNELKDIGNQFLRTDQIDKLRQIIDQLYNIMIITNSETDTLDIANIIRG